MPITSNLIELLRSRFRLEWNGIHGVPHWSRVRINGLLLARENGANERVIEHFAFLHDVCRDNDDHDPQHGPRAANFAREIRSQHISLSDHEFELLISAVEGHTHGSHYNDITIQSCWDADRLDLARVGIVPNPNRLCTFEARNPDMIDRASHRAITWLKRYCEVGSSR